MSQIKPLLSKPKYDTSHNEAFKMVGALPPSARWSSFDVLGSDKDATLPQRFVTTLRNSHEVEVRGKIVPAVAALHRDPLDGKWWCGVERPAPDCERPNQKAHWNAVTFALQRKIQTVGILKDFHGKGKLCCIDPLFDLRTWREDKSGEYLWLCFEPRKLVDLDVTPVNIRARAKMPSVEQLALEERFEIARARALSDTQLVLELKAPLRACTPHNSAIEGRYERSEQRSGSFTRREPIEGKQMSKGVDRNTAAIVCVHCASEGAPIRLAERGEPEEAADSGWQFLCGAEEERCEDASVWSVQEVLDEEPTLSDLIDSPVGTRLARQDGTAPWEIVPTQVN